MNEWTNECIFIGARSDVQHYFVSPTASQTEANLALLQLHSEYHADDEVNKPIPLASENVLKNRKIIHTVRKKKQKSTEENK